MRDPRRGYIVVREMQCPSGHIVAPSQPVRMRRRLTPVCGTWPEDELDSARGARQRHRFRLFIGR